MDIHELYNEWQNSAFNGTFDMFLFNKLKETYEREQELYAEVQHWRGQFARLFPLIEKLDQQKENPVSNTIFVSRSLKEQIVKVTKYIKQFYDKLGG